jgi:hypothetical protein
MARPPVFVKRPLGASSIPSRFPESLLLGSQTFSSLLSGIPIVMVPNASAATHSIVLAVG